MKKIFKNPIFTFILGAVIFGGIVGVSAYTILANDIGYTPKDSTWKKANGEDITNVKDAIDDLYSKAQLKSHSLTVAQSSSRGVFNVPNGIEYAYAIFTDATTGNQEYNLKISGEIIKEEPILMSSISKVDNGLWSRMQIYQLKLTGNEGIISCLASGASGGNFGYQINLVY